jgi:hypothetical protein
MSKISAFYKTFEEAREACLKLGILTVAEYRVRRQEDKWLPSNPEIIYKDKWRGFRHFSGRNILKFHNYNEAKCAVIKLGITTAREYSQHYRKDYRLPSRPNGHYAETWEGWCKFLHKEEKYDDYYEARQIARSYNFRTTQDYKESCLEIDARLYASPNLVYAEWDNWYDYLGIEAKPVLFTFEESRELVSKNNISTAYQYKIFRQKESRLPSSPESTYQKQWINWAHFLKINCNAYKSYPEAKVATNALGLATEKEYAACYTEDPRLIKNPAKHYKNSWTGWADFLGEASRYKTIEQATAATRRLGITSKSGYLADFSDDPLLPKRPDIFYSRTWPKTGWREFIHGKFHATMRTAGAAARELGIVTAGDYMKLSHKDSKLPKTPSEYYREYTNWKDFILPEKCSTLAEARFAVKVLGIKDSVEYRQKQSKYSCLPANPNRSFNDEWIDWYDLCDIPTPYTYDEATTIARSANLKTAIEYKNFVYSSGDPRLPLTPDKVYHSKWVNWISYLGKDEPYTLGSLRMPFDKWQPAIAAFLRRVKGAAAKENYIVRFVRDFLMPIGIGHDPIQLFTTDRFKMEEFETFVSSIKESLQRKVVNGLREFSIHYIQEHLSIKCDYTGELTLIEGVRDPFAPFSKDIGHLVSHGETVKPALAYQFVAGMRDWIIPFNATTFSDLKHLQGYEADWHDIDESLIDRDDPNCVYKCVNDKYKIWFPGYWMHTYALASVPVRGMQLGYVDSGEADKEIPVIKDGKIVWINNPLTLNEKTKKQGFVKKYPNNENGMHLTTNKTSRKRPYYDVPWIPEALALWSVRLRQWQTKYNPISRPMPWIECRFTNLCEDDLKKKGKNCFLFRDFKSEECSGSFSSRLHSRIAIALYYSQPKSLKLATLNGSPGAVTAYTSEYTPHTMRVSLITAYVMEFRLPLEIIVKIAGHSSVIMSIYYVKINNEMLRLQFNEGEKRALSNQAKAAYQMVEQGRLNKIRSQLITNNDEAIKRFVGEIAAGSALYRDYGMCPFAANRCNDGYEDGNGKYVYVPAGYLGSENCVRCRHFVTGPVFLGGLLSLANEISLAATMQFDHLHDMEQQSAKLRESITKFDTDQYDCEQNGLKFDETARNKLELEVISLLGQIETASRKADMYLSDMNSINRLANQCQAVMNERIDSNDDSDSTQLIMQPDHEAIIVIEETSFFHQLNEVCINAEIYVSAKAELAVAPRAQMLDRMIELNNMKPMLFRLDAKQQLILGNQLIQFMLARLKSWDKLDAVVEGRLLMQDLPLHERVTEGSIQKLLSGANATEVMAQALESDSNLEPAFELINGAGAPITAKDSYQAFIENDDREYA